MKKIVVLFIIIFVAIMLSAGGCRTVGSEQTEQTRELIESSGEESASVEGLPAGFPGTVPMHDGADIIESSSEVIDGGETYFVNMRFEGEIDQLSGWYEDELEKNWQIDSVSSGDYDDWAEFYVDAQNSQYYLSVYLYQDAGSNSVSIDINVGEKGGIAEADGEPEEAADDGQHKETADGSAAAYSGELESAEIVFVCASVGSAWNINEHFPGLSIAVYDEYQFDKGNVIRDILASDKPDIMIIKECAAYFPPEEMGTTMEAYRDLIRDWVNLCRGEAVIPVLATVVPIDPDNISSLEGQLESILEYNDWIHDYCRNENIPVLDLEAALRDSEENRILDPDYDSGDGLHPNDLAYSEKLDYILIPALEEALETGY